MRERLGGSRAAVHRGVDRRSGRTVVLKTAPWDRPAVTAALAREAAILRRVGHPSLVRLVDVVEDLDGRTLVLANCAEGDLTRLLARDGPLDAARAADLGARLAGALAALHDVAVVHRDVRPSNVVVDAELVPVLCDLDHALDPSQPGLASDTDVVGDAAHVDPRLLDGLPQGPGMDLFGLGSVVWAAATGGRPRPDDLAGVAGRLPPLLLSAIDACLSGTIGDARAASAAFAAAATEGTAWRPALAAPTAAEAQHADGGPPTTAGDTTSPSPTTGRADHGDDDGPPPTDARDDTLPTWRDAAAAVPRRAGDAPLVGRRPPRVAALAGGGEGRTNPTRRWRVPAATGHTTVGAPEAGRPDWLVPVATATAAVAVLAIGAVLVRPWADDRTSVDVAAPAVEETTSLAAVTPPPPCDSTGPMAATEPTTVLADLTGDGCSQQLRLDDGVLTTPDGRYSLGQPGDQLVAGDWDGDGGWSPGLYRPTTGELFLFDATPSAGHLTSRPAEQRDAEGLAVVTAPQPDGPHEVVVVRP